MKVAACGIVRMEVTTAAKCELRLSAKTGMGRVSICKGTPELRWCHRLACIEPRFSDVAGPSGQPPPRPIGIGAF